MRPTPDNARRWVAALAQLPDGAARELEGDETLHEEPYAIRINDEFIVDVMNSASGFSWDDLIAYRERIEGVWVISLRGHTGHARRATPIARAARGRLRHLCNI